MLNDLDDYAPEPEFADEPASGATLIVLGLNAWATSVGWTLLPADVGLRDAALGSSQLLWLLIGAMLHVRVRSQRGQEAARWLLLCVYPVSLAAALCLGSEAARERVHTPWSMLLCALSMLAYGVAATLACREPLSLLSSVTHTRQRERAASAVRPRRLRNTLIALMLSGALAIALVAPLLPAYEQVQAAWGGASEAGAVLAAVVGGALGISVIGIYLGALLHGKAPEVTYTARESRARVATLLFLALLGAVVYLTVIN